MRQAAAERGDWCQIRPLLSNIPERGVVARKRTAGSDGGISHRLVTKQATSCIMSRRLV